MSARQFLGHARLVAVDAFAGARVAYEALPRVAGMR